MFFVNLTDKFISLKPGHLVGNAILTDGLLVDNDVDPKDEVMTKKLEEQQLPSVL